MAHSRVVENNPVSKSWRFQPPFTRWLANGLEGTSVHSFFGRLALHSLKFEFLEMPLTRVLFSTRPALLLAITLTANPDQARIGKAELL